MKKNWLKNTLLIAFFFNSIVGLSGLASAYIVLPPPTPTYYHPTGSYVYKGDDSGSYLDLVANDNNKMTVWGVLPWNSVTFDYEFSFHLYFSAPSGCYQILVDIVDVQRDIFGGLSYGPFFRIDYTDGSIQLFSHLGEGRHLISISTSKQVEELWVYGSGPVSMVSLDEVALLKT